MRNINSLPMSNGKYRSFAPFFIIFIEKYATMLKLCLYLKLFINYIDLILRDQLIE